MVAAVNANTGLYLYTGNRLEELAGALAEVVRLPLSNPFTAERIVVQSLGMERWLTQQLARAYGICANVSFLFPQRFVGELMNEALPERANTRFYSRENLTWRIMALLPGLVRGKEFAELRRYLEGRRPELRRFQLSEKIASAFDRYLAFRPRMVLDWENVAGASDWQAILWRKLVEEAPGLHPPGLAEQFKTVLRSGRAPLPERVSLFGISTLPPFYLQFLEELAGRTAVHLFIMRPTPHFWGATFLSCTILPVERNPRARPMMVRSSSIPVTARCGKWRCCTTSCSRSLRNFPT
jgi:exodeoxyribonuclease V gamma subunit